METLAISAANLDTIEKNLGAVAKELGNVISDVSSVNNQVNKVEEQVNNLNDEIKKLVKEIKETTIVTNARQSIMYNNSITEKNYGYFNQVRRNTESLLAALGHSSISKTSLLSLRQEIILNNPNYWLSSALASLISWILNDKENCEKELNNALRKNSKKTSLFFFFVNHKLNRQQTAINWLKKYLSEQDPYNLDKDLLTIIDLSATNTISTEAKKIIFDKINDWEKVLKLEKRIENQQIDFWKNYISSNEESDIKMPCLEVYSPDVSILKNNLTITSSYINVLNDLETIYKANNSYKTVEEVLSNLIYDYEEKEQTYQLNNLKNELIIACDGNKEEANELYEKQKLIYSQETDLLTLLSNIIVYKDSFKLSNETLKIALAIVKPYIIKAYDEKKKQINTDPFCLMINNFKTTTTDGTNSIQIRTDLENYLNSQYTNDNKDLIIALIIINIIGIISIFITLNNKILSILLILILIIGNIALFNKIKKRNNIYTFEKNKLRTTIFNNIERLLAETIDYKNMMNEDETQYINLLNFLNTLNIKDYMFNSNERNISIGE